MCSKKILLTVLAVMLGGLTPLSYAAQRLVNLDYAKHTNALCAGTTYDVVGAYDLTDDDPANTSEAFGGGSANNAITLNGDPTVATAIGCLPAIVDTNTGAGAITGFGQTSGTAANLTSIADMDSGIIDSDETTGRLISAEILKGGAGTIPEGFKADGVTNTPKYAGVMYTIDGTIADTADVTFTLSNGVFDGNPWFAVYDADTTDAGGGGGDFPAGWSWVSGGNNANNVKYRISSSATSKLGDNGDMANLDSAKLFLLYRIQDASALETAGGSVKMSVSIQTGTTPVSNLGTGEVTIFTSKSSLTAKITSEDKGTAYVSVGDDNKLITDDGENTVPALEKDEGAFRDVNRARIGYLEVGIATVFEPDGVTLFEIGAGKGAIDEAASELVISGGQFAASKLGPGKVRLFGINDAAGSDAEITNVVASDDGLATFKLTNAVLQKIVGYEKVAIEFIPDTTNAINIPEDRPKGSLTLEFADEEIGLDEATATALQNVELRRIPLNGTECWAFNVPYATVQDRFNIRITNESPIPGKITATIYEASGTEKGEAVLQGIEGLVTAKVASKGTDDTIKEYLQPKHTIHLNSEKLEAIFGTAWEGRAVVRFRSQLPDMEMLAMLRNQLMDEASQPLNNLSLGAHGDSCQGEQ